MKFLFVICCLILLSYGNALTSRGDAFHPRNKLKGLPGKLLAQWEATKKPKQNNVHFSAGVKSLRVTPQQFGGDPTGQVDSTKALQGNNPINPNNPNNPNNFNVAALAYCLNVSTYTPGVFSFGAKDSGGCEVDLNGGEFLTSQPLLIPTNISNMRIGGNRNNPK